MTEGRVEPGFEGVADQMRANLERRGDVGAACCVYVDGHPVVDIWAGIADVAIDRFWEEDTLALVFSTTKGVTAICATSSSSRGCSTRTGASPRSGPSSGRTARRTSRFGP